MATLTQPKVSSSEAATTIAEHALWEAFADHLDTLPAEKRKTVLEDLHANAVDDGE